MSDQGSGKKPTGLDPASSVIMTAPLDKAKELTGKYKRFHDATDTGPSTNTATGLMHEAAEAVSKGLNVLRGTLGREGEKAAGSGVVSGVKETGKSWAGGNDKPADRGVEAATSETTKSTLDATLERAKSEGAAYYAKLKDTLPHAKAPAQDTTSAGRDAGQAGVDKAQDRGSQAVASPPLTSLFGHLPHLNSPEVVTKLGHAPENYGVDKPEVSPPHEPPDYVKTMGHAPENYGQAKVEAPEESSPLHLDLPSIFKKTG